MQPMTLLLITISLLISVAFFTMMERKLLSYMQNRKGPNKVGFLGILQPFSDAIKLLNKTKTQTMMNNKITSTMLPPLTLMLSTLFIPLMTMNKFSEVDITQSTLMLMIISSMMVYAIFMLGWSMNTKYSMLGSIRNMAQMISYEVSIFFLILALSMISSSYMFFHMSETQKMWWLLWGNMPLFLMWAISILAETNRTPFDFTEGESELVSGFNVEFMGGFFTLIFLAEYTSIIIMSMATSLLFIGSINSMLNIIPLTFITLAIIWIRGTLPRFRYDKLMKLSWKTILPTIMLSLPMSLLFSMT